jgi:glutathione S-transferase
MSKVKMSQPVVKLMDASGSPYGHRANAALLRLKVVPYELILDDIWTTRASCCSRTGAVCESLVIVEYIDQRGL